MPPRRPWRAPLLHFNSPTDGPPAYSVEEILECATEEFYNNGNGNLFGCGGGSAAFGLLHAVDYGGIGAEVYEPYAAAAGNETLEGTPLTISDCSAVSPGTRFGRLSPE